MKRSVLLAFLATIILIAGILVGYGFGQRQ